MKEYGPTDSGEPLHLFIISGSRKFSPAELKNQGKSILLINNAIHAGEPEGIDASVMFARDLLSKEKFPGLNSLLDKMVILIIPVYNIGGTLNRNSFSRVNQNGPESYGFRGNAQNLDLNRDFIKCDSKNARSFIQIFREWDPDVFIDNHTSDGADYKHVLSYIATQHNKLSRPLGNYLKEVFVPSLDSILVGKGISPVPYVVSKHSTPDSGIVGFMDSPRYSTGYASLFHTPGFVTETHMLKPFADRLRATYAFMEAVSEVLYKQGENLIRMRSLASVACAEQTDFPISWQLDTLKTDSVLFEGYEPAMKTSRVTGFPYVFYDHSSPFRRKIVFYNYYREKISVRKPYAYVIPQGWYSVSDLLKLNGIKVFRLMRDTAFSVSAYFISDFKTLQEPYEKHYLHSETKIETQIQNISFRTGDFVVFVNQPANRFIVEVLEPVAADSYFNWNFFDAILQQKEYFDGYRFEEIADSILRSDSELKIFFDERRNRDPEFSKSPQAQLDFIYQHSPYKEAGHRRYPVFRLEEETILSVRD